jgi:hypothetical protein
MAGSTNKKVSVIRFEREPVPGTLSLQDYVTPGGIELLSVSGSLVTVPFDEAKAVCFLRDFDDASPWKSNRAFGTRPKSAGLWIRIVFRDGDSLEGMIANDLTQIERDGITVIPPEPGASAQRIFVPRQASKSIQVLGVIGSPLRRAQPKGTPKPEPGQMVMFD